MATHRTASQHVLMITNHGMHEWRVIPGMPDTGGQNVYVNHLSDALVRLGRRVTIVNRGGYPHPVTGVWRTGTADRHGGQARIVYLTDDTAEFVRKEDMAGRLPSLAASLADLLRSEDFDLIVSHYWDGAALGLMAADRAGAAVPHVWVPHSVGTLKKRNMDPATWEHLRLDERIARERDIVARVDGIVATSSVIRTSIEEDYGAQCRFFLPPGIDTGRFHPRTPEECPGMWEFLAAHAGVEVERIRGRLLVAEVSRTDVTKRKDVLLRAFASAHSAHPNSLLAVTIDEGNRRLHDELQQLVDDLGLRGDVAVLGSIWEHLPCLYAMSDLYCTPSVMEGFGMSAQEAAACGVPVIASDLVPFAVEYLLGPDPDRLSVADGTEILVGSGAIVVPPDSVAGFAAAMEVLLEDAQRRARMGAAALAVTVASLTWDRLTAAFLDTFARVFDDG